MHDAVAISALFYQRRGKVTKSWELQDDWMSGMWGRRRKKKPTHPCWHVQRLITMAAVSTDVGLRGGLSISVRVCVQVCAHVRLCVCDSVWQWSEGYLAMTAADTMGPFLYLSIQCSLSSSHLSSCPPLPSPFLKSLPPHSSYSLFSQHFIFSWSVAWCTPVVLLCVRATNEWHSLSRNSLSSSASDLVNVFSCSPPLFLW